MQPSEKKITSNSLKKNKAFISSTPLQLTFQMNFFIGVYIEKKAIFILFKILFYLFNFLK
jgi:hypothetical protein